MQKLAFLLFLPALAAPSASLLSQQRFAVCDVVRATQPLPEMPYRQAVESLVGSIDWAAPETPEAARKARSQPPLKPKYVVEDFADRAGALVAVTGVHPFAAAVAHAYGEHRPLVISPDMVWLMILQGFAAHVDQNGEKLRSKFVDFEGKKMLIVERGPGFRKGSADNDWEGVFPEFSEQIGRYTGPEVRALADLSFSTSTKVEQASFHVTLMDGMSSYFLYGVRVVCGIPEVTLEGTPEDWEAIERQAAALRRYELGWWVDSLLPVLHQFTLASRGQVDRDFWADIYQVQRVPAGCTSEKHIDGWLLDFFPYIHNRPNPLLQAGSAKSEAQASSGIELQDLPLGISRAELLFIDLDQKMYNMRLAAGFLGLRQDAQTLSLRPEITWTVIDTGLPPSEEMTKGYAAYLKEERGMRAKRD
jgi:hypothetical protein